MSRSQDVPTAGKATLPPEEGTWEPASYWRGREARLASGVGAGGPGGCWPAQRLLQGVSGLEDIGHLLHGLVPASVKSANREYRVTASVLWEQHRAAQGRAPGSGGLC